MLVITPFTVVVELGSNSAVSEWCAAAGSANTTIETATRAAYDIGFIGISGYAQFGVSIGSCVWDVKTPKRRIRLATTWLSLCGRASGYCATPAVRDAGGSFQGPFPRPLRAR